MTYTTPSDRSTGYLVTDTTYNDEIVGNIDFLATTKPMCKVYRSSQTLSDDILTTISFTSAEFYDTASMHEGVTNPTRITIPTAGIYDIGGRVVIPSTQGQGAQIIIRKNGTTTISSGYASEAEPAFGLTSTVFTVSVCEPVVFVATDYIEMRVQQRSGGAFAVESFFWATWIATG